MTIVDSERLRTVVHDGPDGIVLSLHGALSRDTVPAVDSLLATIRDCGDDAITIDLLGAEIDPDVAELIERRWGVSLA